VYYASMLRCWHLVRILVRTDHPCLGVGCHKRAEEFRENCSTCHIYNVEGTTQLECHLEAGDVGGGGVLQPLLCLSWSSLSVRIGEMIRGSEPL
jgi:hypothetical protein